MLSLLLLLLCVMVVAAEQHSRVLLPLTSSQQLTAHMVSPVAAHTPTAVSALSLPYLLDRRAIQPVVAFCDRLCVSSLPRSVANLPRSAVS